MEMAKAVETRFVVLYADDDTDDLMLTQDAFTSYASNIDVVTAGDGKQALSYLESLSPNDPAPCLVILDINMPRMNGKEALQAIRSIKRFEDIPIVLFTNSSLPVDKIFAQRYHSGFLTKPLDAKAMQMIAEQFVDYFPEEVKEKIQKRANR
jgi:CheY-like chemotaxis protein